MSSRGEFGQVASRLRRPGWRDPRLLVGVVLVALAVALGAWTVGQADRTTPVLVAHGVLTPGQPLSGERVGVMRVHLADASRYLSPDESLPTGAVITRTVGDGELIPRSSVGDGDGLGLRPVAVPVQTTLADGVRPGARVDLWYTPDRDSIAAGAAPHAVAEGLTVVEVGKDTGSFSISSPSRRAICGKVRSSKNDILKLRASSVRMFTFETSVPDPAVVGIAITGNGGLLALLKPS